MLLPTAAVATLTLGVAATAPAQAAAPSPAILPVATSSFEQPTVPPNTFLEPELGQTFDGWRVTAGTVDLIGQGYWQAADGVQSVDLNGRDEGSISRRFETAPRRPYELQFSLAGNPEGGPDGGSAVKQVRVTAGNESREYSFDTTGHSTSQLGYRVKSLRFGSVASATRVTFASLTPGQRGPVIDAVRLCPIRCPRPAVG